MNINYSLLSRAIDHYEHYRYKMVEVPWIVTPEASRATNPPEGGIFVLKDGGHLVGSAEQGFIQIMHELDPYKKYMSVSPCFRRGDNRDEYHQETFLKLELFSYCTEFEKLDDLIENHKRAARNVAILLGIDPESMGFYQESKSNCDLEVHVGEDKYLEIGSYGYRSFGDTHIAYGTGIALPRFQQAFEEQIYAS